MGGIYSDESGKYEDKSYTAMTLAEGLEAKTCKCGCDKFSKSGWAKGHSKRPEWPPYTVDSATNCWVWKGGLTVKGYGQRRVMGRSYLAHTWMWIMKNGPVPDGLVVDHLCRNRACVNVDHLEPVSNKENVLRGVGPMAINLRKTHCKRGHEFSGENLRPVMRNGKPRRACRICAHFLYKRSLAKKKGFAYVTV